MWINGCQLYLYDLHVFIVSFYKSNNNYQNEWSSRATESEGK